MKKWMREVEGEEGEGWKRERWRREVEKRCGGERGEKERLCVVRDEHTMIKSRLLCW